MKKLYKFHWDCGRMGNVRGTFSADDLYVKSCIGKQVYFGEILGKHSDVYGNLEEKDLTVLSDDQDFIEKFEKLIGDSGYNPLSYMNEEEGETDEKNEEDFEEYEDDDK